MEYNFEKSYNLKEFIELNSKKFEDKLLTEAVNVRDKINEILAIGNIDLVNNAHKLVVYIIDDEEEKLTLFAKQEGIAWATHSIDLNFKLEWVQAIRRTLWRFIQIYYKMSNNTKLSDFFDLEQQINNRVDQFLNSFFISYSTYKDSLITAHRELVEKLSVPIIPITPDVCILPLIGSIDSLRTSILEDKVLTEIGQAHIQTLIMDLSGIAEIENDIIGNLMKIIDGAALMGCNTIITGLRPEVVRKIVKIGVKFDFHTKTFGSLQQALKQFIK
ncbi:STAS domain-containing protein [Robertmurraya sp. DFI.2.37]|jgi:anti-anti-sigma regulatory factor|uniref:STAS domain-containing protein n=1 Tax=Robertmurraya sp. DFI.2.37 TaxID=3031819 RepID=UPI001245EF86|nr:STAS domain-containing protein [Robertmurraya sp. DFI.2.37]MDF1507080.1 STAS domain-containing protein [Robertmurraya sp. DFI.2.37]